MEAFLPCVRTPLACGTRGSVCAVERGPSAPCVRECALRGCGTSHERREGPGWLRSLYPSARSGRRRFGIGKPKCKGRSGSRVPHCLYVYAASMSPSSIHSSACVERCYGFILSVESRVYTVLSWARPHHIA